MGDKVDRRSSLPPDDVTLAGHTHVTYSSPNSSWTKKTTYILTSAIKLCDEFLKRMGEDVALNVTRSTTTLCCVLPAYKGTAAG
ncbi:hypothetical protein J6590_058846 [Homalodisca vitripennis]|nr:hypothetical protein J6590_058846 [Homalodisca vitripennis]